MKYQRNVNIIIITCLSVCPNLPLIFMQSLFPFKFTIFYYFALMEFHENCFCCTNPCVQQKGNDGRQ